MKEWNVDEVLHGEKPLRERIAEEKRENIECAEALNTAIVQHYNENSLNTENAMEMVLSAFAPERAAYCMAEFVDSHQHDGRISEENKEWAKEVLADLPDDYRKLAKPEIVRTLEHAGVGLANLMASELRENLDLTADKEVPQHE